MAPQLDEKIEEASSPHTMTGGELEDHIIGVILASHFSLKKGSTLFGDKADIITTKELQQIHNMDTCKAPGP